MGVPMNNSEIDVFLAINYISDSYIKWNIIWAASNANVAVQLKMEIEIDIGTLKHDKITPLANVQLWVG